MLIGADGVGGRWLVLGMHDARWSLWCCRVLVGVGGCWWLLMVLVGAGCVGVCWQVLEDAGRC